MLYTEFRIDMTLLDDKVMALLSAKMNPETKTVGLKLYELASAIGCHYNSICRSTKRLEKQKKIAKHGGRGRDGIQYQVLI
jgi:hypothetical protein